jgi:mannose-6-phosphate isomerase
MPLHRVRPGNFTPPTRTPWGGRAIVRSLKAGLNLDVDSDSRVGESWEVSVEPSFPTVLDSGEALPVTIASNPDHWLGPAVVREFGGCPLLVKLIDAADDLSVQVHPPEAHPILAEGESGKTEAWIVLAAEPGAHIYLGFRDGVDEREARSCLDASGDMSELMNAIEVRPGEVYLLRPGLAHALGAGTTVLEPQRVWPGHKAITYRFWDWNRRYDDQGRVDPGGSPRALHIREAIAVTDWKGPRGAALVEQCRRQPRVIDEAAGLKRVRLLDEPELWTERWSGAGAAPLPEIGTLMAVLCLDGQIELQEDGGTLRLVRGETAVVPAATTGVMASLSDGDVALCCVPG